jgi:hypothetical protein
MKISIKKGYSVVEVLLAGTLLAIVAGGVVTAFIYAQRSNQSSFAREKALRIAEEGVQAVRMIRQEEYDLLVNAPSVGLSFEDNAWELVYYPTENDDTSTDGFRRRLRIEDGPTTFSKAITVRVSYAIGRRNREVELKTIVSSLSEGNAMQIGDGRDELVSENYIIQDDSQASSELQNLSMQSVQNIGNIEFWYSADQNISRSEGIYTSLWYDMSGNGHHVVQTDPDTRPMFEDGVINGYPALKFDGQNDHLVFPSIDFAGNNGMTVFVVASTTADLVPTAGEGSYGAFAFQSEGVGKFYVSPQRNSITYNFGDPTDISYSRPIGVGEDFTLTGVRKVQGSEEIYVDGNLVNSVSGRAFPTGAIGNTGYVGRSTAAQPTFFQGYIAELLVFDKGLTASEYAVAQNYLNEKYNLY